MVRDGFDFLSFRFHGNKVSPTRAAKQDLFAKIEKELRNAHRTIQAPQNAPRRAEPRLVQVLGSVDCRIRGWGDAFKDVDQRLEFAQMDNEIRKIVDRSLRRFFGAQIGIVTPDMMRAMGLALLADTPVTKCEAPGSLAA